MLSYPGKMVEVYVNLHGEADREFILFTTVWIISIFTLIKFFVSILQTVRDTPDLQAGKDKEEFEVRIKEVIE